MGLWHSEEVAARWDSSLGRGLPTRAEQQQILLALLDPDEIADGVVLDLGVGSGLVAEAILDALPRAGVLGVDSSQAMLELARERLERFGPRARLLQHDLAQVDTIDVPAGRYPAAFSVQTLHHLTDAEKERATAWVARRLAPGGLWVIVDRVAVPEALFADWAATWRRLGADTPGTYAEYRHELEQGGDRPALLEDQLRWMIEAGLTAACLHAYGNRAVLVGRKPR
jgi:tRNA (cmo5U34)-methyltransferase